MTRDIPSNSVAVGNPCRVCCSLEEYYEKRKQTALKEAIENVNEYIVRYNSWPTTKNLKEEWIYFPQSEFQKQRAVDNVFPNMESFIEYCVHAK